MISPEALREIVDVLKPVEVDDSPEGLARWQDVRRKASCLALPMAEELIALRAALKDAVKSWSFDDGQAHTHSWHDKQDWMERHKEALR